MAAHLILGIDVGMTGTGVAFSTAGMDAPDVFTSWPRSNDDHKVPTRLGYDVSGPSPKLVSWGFDSSPGNIGEGVFVAEWFKVDLGNEKANQELIERYYFDHLRCLYATLSKYFTPSKLKGLRWDEATIQFLFSAPATWSPDVVATFRQIAADAGFEKSFELCTGGTALFQDGPVLIADAGGGTVDFCLLQLDTRSKTTSEVTELTPTFGTEVGSAYIDADFREDLESSLEEFKPDLGRSAKETAWLMLDNHKFKNLKCSLGKPNGSRGQFIEIPDIKNGHSIQSQRHSISDQGMRVTTENLKPYFDEQVGPLKKRINIIADWSATRRPGTFPMNSVFSSPGGLGSSAYVQRALKDHLSRDSMPISVELDVCKSPRLAVCLGLILYALKTPEINLSLSVRASFGITCRIRQSSSLQALWKTRGETHIVTDRFRQRWIGKGIDWFVNKGDRVNGDQPITRQYSATFDADVPPSKRICQLRIVSSTKSNPPKLEDTGDIHIHLEMKVDLSCVKSIDVQEVNKEWYKKAFGKKPHVKVPFIIEAKIGPAEANFRFLDVDKNIILGEPSRIDVESKNIVEPIMFLSESEEWAQVDA